MENKISKLMKNLGISREEAIDIIEYDNDVDKNNVTEYDLDKEQLKIAKSYSITTSEAKMQPKKSKLQDSIKESIIDSIYECLENEGFVENIEITNNERQISFSINEQKFEVNLVQKRK